MGDLREFSAATRLFLKAYRWRQIDPVPWTPLAKPLAECRVALISSAGFHTNDQVPFDETKRGGDPTFRSIAADVQLGSLENAHRSETFDHEPMLRDPNVALPLDRLRELERAGRIGSIGPRVLSFMGSLTATRRFLTREAPQAAGWLEEDAIDVALLVPV